MQATRTCACIITPYLVHTSPQWSYVVIRCCFAELVDPAWLGGCIQCCVGKMEQNIESLLPTPLCLPSVDMSWGFSILTASRYWGKLIPCHDENIESLDFTTCFECKRCENDLWFVQHLIKSRPSGGNYYKLLRGDCILKDWTGCVLTIHVMASKTVSFPMIQFSSWEDDAAVKGSNDFGQVAPKLWNFESIRLLQQCDKFLGAEGSKKNTSKKIKNKIK